MLAVLVFRPMRTGTILATSVLAGVLFAPRVVMAQAFDWRGTVGLSGGYNAILTNAEFPGPNNSSGPFAMLSTSLTGTLETPRTNSSFTYSLSLNVPIDKNFNFNTTPIRHSHRFGYDLRAALSPLVNLTLGAGVSVSPNLMFTGGGDPTEVPYDSAVPVGTSINLTSNVTEALNFDLTKDSSLRQSFSGAFGTPIDPFSIRPKSIALTASFGYSKHLALDTITLTPSSTFSYFTEGESQNGAYIEPRKQMNNSLSLSWARPLNNYLNISLQAGVQQNISLDLGKQGYGPTGGATLNLNLEVLTIALSFTHATAVNVLTSTMSLTDQVGLRLSSAFGDTGLSASLSGNFVHAEPLFTEGTSGSGILNTPTNNVSADGGLTFTPKSIQGLSFNLRGQFQKQLTSTNPDAAFTRLGLNFGVTYAFPGTKNKPRAPFFTSGGSVQLGGEGPGFGPFGSGGPPGPSFDEPPAAPPAAPPAGDAKP